MKWYWPLVKFWTYSPLGYVCAIAWNVSEFLNVPVPFSGWMFGKIVGCKGRKVK